ncbi:MAG: hypothetical protein EBZ16_05520 [Flavobacteriia bacterium]|nr:hypothetical protein [Flavobacteriia bacterium]
MHIDESGLGCLHRGSEQRQVSDTRFPREERLKLRNRIAHLFETGRRFSEGPVQVLWCLSSWPMERSAQVLVGAPKRRFKHAVDRNRFKRLKS